MLTFYICVVFPADASGHHYLLWLLGEERGKRHRRRSQRTDRVHHPVQPQRAGGFSICLLNSLSLKSPDYELIVQPLGWGNNNDDNKFGSERNTLARNDRLYINYSPSVTLTLWRRRRSSPTPPVQERRKFSMDKKKKRERSHTTRAV